MPFFLFWPYGKNNSDTEGLFCPGRFVFTFFQKHRSFSWIVDRTLFVSERNVHICHSGHQGCVQPMGHWAAPCFPPINFQKKLWKYIKPAKKWLQYSHPLCSDSLVSSGECCVKERTSQRMGTCEELFEDFFFFYFHRCPLDNPSKDSIVSDKRRSESFSSCFTHSVNNQHLREFTDAVCQSLGKKREPNYGSNPTAPVIAPSHPHFRQMTELLNPPANQLITATIGN